MIFTEHLRIGAVLRQFNRDIMFTQYAHLMKTFKHEDDGSKHNDCRMR